jgi:hypothetical protein
LPRVSVVIPTYNRASYLIEAVESVLAQTYRDFEVIVIDDGSTDNTPEVASGFPPEVKYFRQENQGQSASRNRGIKLAQGEYTIFLDSDDVLLENTLQKSVTFLDEHPEAGFCGGQFYTIDENGRPLRQKKPRGPRATFIRAGKDEITHLLVGTGGMHLSTVLIRRSCFEEVGLFDTSLPMSEDWDMWIRLSKKFSVGHLAEPMAKIRFHSQNITATTGVGVVQSAHTAVLESVFQDAKLGPLYEHLRKKAYFGLHCLCSRVSARTGHRWTSLLYLLRAVKTCPAMLLKRRGVRLLMKSANEFLSRRLRNIVVQILMALRLR